MQRLISPPPAFIGKLETEEQTPSAVTRPYTEEVLQAGAERRDWEVRRWPAPQSSTGWRLRTICAPFVLKSKDLLERKGYTADDHELTSRAETDAFQEELGGDTNVPLRFISLTENLWMGVKPWALAA